VSETSFGAQLVEVVEQEDRKSYATVTNSESANTNPHWAFTAEPEDLVRFVEHLKNEGIPFSGPRSHRGVTLVSVYFQDCDGNNLEVTAWTTPGSDTIESTPMGGQYGHTAWSDLSHNWRPRE
jgi:catechol-2,3-dioxygenase